MAWSDVLAGALRLIQSGVDYVTRPVADIRSSNRLKNEEYADKELAKLQDSAKKRPKFTKEDN